MGYVVREADLERELPIIVELMNASFPDPVSLPRFEWMYLANPWGRATAWFVVDDRSGQPVGSTAVFPRRVRLPDGRLLRGWLGGDFSILPKYRTLGVATKLRRAAKDAIDNGVADLLFAHPNDRMLAVHKAVGHSVLGQMVRYARPIAIAGRGQLIGAVSRAVLAALDRLNFRAAGLPGQFRHEHDCGSDFTMLCEKTRPANRAAVVRTGAYLAWRFLQNPVQPHRLLSLRRDDELVGFVAYTLDACAIHIKDWGAVDRQALVSLVAHCTSCARQLGLASVSVAVLDGHPDLPVLRSLGFLKRPDESTAVVYTRAAEEATTAVLVPSSWAMTVGDRDV